MQRLLVQFLMIALIFSGLFLSLKQVDFLKHADVERMTQKSSAQLGKIMVETLLLHKQEIKDPQLILIIDSIKSRLSIAAGIPQDSIQLHIIRDTEINAFALPGNHIIVLTGLINYSKNADELAGVLSHEIGHLKLGHIEKKLIKEVGLTMLFAMAGGNGGQEVIKEVIQTISSTSFDRTFEEEADLFAVKTMCQAGFDAEFLSAFMLRISQQESVPELIVWMSSHPDSKERAAAILVESKKYISSKHSAISTPWEEVQQMIK